MSVCPKGKVAWYEMEKQTFLSFPPCLREKLFNLAPFLVYWLPWGVHKLGGCAGKSSQSQLLCYPQEKEMTRGHGWWCTPEINLHSPSSTSLAFPLGLSQKGGRASSLLQGGCPTSAALGYNNERDTYNGRFCFLYNQWQWWKSHSILLASFKPLCNISH